MNIRAVLGFLVAAIIPAAAVTAAGLIPAYPHSSY